MALMKFGIIAIFVFLGFLSGFFIAAFEVFPYEVVKNTYVETQNDSFKPVSKILLDA